MTPIRKALENPYTVAVAFMRADALARNESGRGLPVSRQLRWFYRRVAELDAAYGRRLDELGATMAQMRWVASPGMGKTARGGRNLAVEARYQALAALLEGRSAFPSFRALVAGFPAIDPRNGKVATSDGSGIVQKTEDKAMRGPA